MKKKTERKIPIREKKLYDAFFLAEHPKRWRIFACSRCGYIKRKWMIWISEKDARINNDHRQQCGVCAMIVQHVEQFPPEEP